MGLAKAVKNQESRILCLVSSPYIIHSLTSFTHIHLLNTHSRNRAVSEASEIVIQARKRAV